MGLHGRGAYCGLYFEGELKMGISDLDKWLLDKQSILNLAMGQETCGQYADGSWSVTRNSNGFEVMLSEGTDIPSEPLICYYVFDNEYEAAGAIGAL